MIASGLIPETSGHKLKTDRTDSEKLAKFFMKDLLTPLNIPDEEDEAQRDLVRSRTLVSKQVSRSGLDLFTSTAFTSIDETSVINFSNVSGMNNGL